MQLLGSLGINISLLLAQIVNFGLLMLLLTYFVYRPTIKIIETNEKELAEGQEAKQALQQEQQAFAELQKKIETETRERNRRTVKEMAAMTDTIKNKTYDAAKEESAALIEQTKQTLESQRPMIENEIAKDLRAKFTQDLYDSFDRQVPSQYRSELQGVLFNIFIDRLNAADLKQIPDVDVEELKRLRETDLDEYEERLRQKIGVILLQYTAAVTPRELSEIERIVSEKIGLDVRIDARRNASLVVGFSLEIEGRLIESNLSSIFANHVERT
jgi:F-type H+-transporting ATPase subunit b